MERTFAPCPRVRNEHVCSTLTDGQEARRGVSLDPFLMTRINSSSVIISTRAIRSFSSAI